MYETKMRQQRFGSCTCSLPQQHGWRGARGSRGSSPARWLLHQYFSRSAAGIMYSLRHRDVPGAYPGIRERGPSPPLPCPFSPFSLTSPFLPPLPFPFPSLPSSSLRSSSPLNQLGSGERCKLPQRSPGPLPRTKTIWMHSKAVRKNIL